MVSLRNQADGLLHGVRKTLKDAGDKVDADEKSRIEAAAKELEDAIKAEDKDAIESKMRALSEVSATLAQKMYADKGATADQGGAHQSGGDDDARGGATDDGAVDAEFEEVKDDKRK